MTAGAISHTVLDTFTLDAVGSSPQFIKTNGIVLAAGYTENAASGTIKTFGCDNNGILSDAQIDSLLLGDAGNSGTEIIHVYADVYAVVHFDLFPTRVKVSTFTIDSSGNIGAALIDNQQLALNAYYPSIIHVSGNIFAVIYWDTTGAGSIRVQTINISNTGIITVGINNVIVASPVNSNQNSPQIIYASGSMFLAAWTDHEGGVPFHGTGTVASINISASGVISLISSKMLAVNGWNTQLLKVYEGLYVLSYTDFTIWPNPHPGFIVSFTVSNTGVISDAINIIQYNADVDFSEFNLLHIGYEAGLAYFVFTPLVIDAGVNLFTTIMSASISPAGALAIIDSFHFTNNYYGGLTRNINGSIYVTVLPGTLGATMAYSFRIDTPLFGLPIVTTIPANTITRQSAIIHGLLDSEGF